MKTTSIIAATLMAALLGAGCSSVADPDGIPMRPLTKAETEIVDASSEFGYNLFRQVNADDRDKSIFISPLSVSMALGMTLNGASGATYDSMRQTLAYAGLTESEINAAYRSLIDLLTQVDPSVKFQIANSIWYRDGFQVEQSFIDTNQYYFDAAVRSLDFSASNAASIINGWVKEKTEGKIEKIVPDPIAGDVVMYLINAIYFKGAWSKTFEAKETKDRPFTLADGSTRQVKTMHRHGDYRYLQNDELQMVDLPYGDSLFSMTVLLPKQGSDINTFVDGLTEAKMKGWIGAAKSIEGDVYLPKFKLEYEKSLNDMLKAMGMSIAFSDMADFSRIRTSGGLYISEVKHKTFVEVNEEGTEAAAATSVEIRETSLPQTFTMNVNRPFVFVIRERTSGAVLFMGKIMEP
jgi:serpin B